MRNILNHKVSPGRLEGCCDYTTVWDILSSVIFRPTDLGETKRPHLWIWEKTSSVYLTLLLANFQIVITLEHTENVWKFSNNLWDSEESYSTVHAHCPFCEYNVYMNSELDYSYVSYISIKILVFPLLFLDLRSVVRTYRWHLKGLCQKIWTVTRNNLSGAPPTFPPTWRIATMCPPNVEMSCCTDLLVQLSTSPKKLSNQNWISLVSSKFSNENLTAN
jgi:hypothetical protein